MVCKCLQLYNVSTDTALHALFLDSHAFGFPSVGTDMVNTKPFTMTKSFVEEDRESVTY